MHLRPVSKLFSLSLVAFVLVFAQVSHAAPEFRFTDINGDAIELKDYRGKWVVVNYWATWCPPCLEEIPELVMFHENHKDDNAVVLGMNMEDKSSRVLSKFVEDNMMTYPVIPKTDDLMLVGDIPGLPTTYLIDPSGKPVAMQVGQVTAQMLEDYIDGQAAR